MQYTVIQPSVLPMQGSRSNFPDHLPSSGQIIRSVQMQNNLDEQIARQIPTNRIALPEVYMGDEGAKILAEQLKRFPSIVLLDLKGNNISSFGFVSIFSALTQNLQIKTLSLEWNKLGQPDIQGLEFLFKLLRENRTITNIDLRNNKINATGAHMIANIIRNNYVLTSIDLRWNEIGNTGAKAILTALKDNPNIISCETSGNGIDDNLSREIRSVCQTHRDGGREQASFYSQTIHPAQQAVQQASFYTQAPPARMTQSVVQQTIPRGQVPVVVQQFENSMRLSPEKYQPSPAQSRHFRHKTYQQQQDDWIDTLDKLIQKERDEQSDLNFSLKTMIAELKNNCIINDQRKKQLEAQVTVQYNENQALQADLVFIRKDVAQICSEKDKKQRDNIEKLSSCEEKMREQEKQYQAMDENAIQGNMRKIKDIDKEWNDKCNDLIDLVNGKRNYGEDLRLQINQQSDQYFKADFQSKESAMEIIHKVKDELHKDYKEKFLSLVNRMNQLDKDKTSLTNKMSQVSRDFVSRQKSTRHKTTEIMVENTRQELYNTDIQLRNKEFKLVIEQFEKELENKDTIIKSLEKEKEQLQDKTSRLEEDYSKKIKDKITQYTDETSDQETDLKQNREIAQELEKSIREHHSETLKLRQDLGKIGDLINSNLSKAVYETFSDNKYI